VWLGHSPTKKGLTKLDVTILYSHAAIEQEIINKLPVAAVAKTAVLSLKFAIYFKYLA
jgi:hypothetical protein